MKDEFNYVYVISSSGCPSTRNCTPTEMGMELMSTTEMEIGRGIVLSLCISLLLTSLLYLIYVLVCKHDNGSCRNRLWIIFFVVIFGVSLLRWLSIV